MIDTGIKDKIIQPAWSQRQVFFKDTQIFFDQDYSSNLQKKRTRIYEVIKQLKRKKGAGEMSIPSKPENKTGCRRKDLCNTNRGCTAAERAQSQDMVRHRRRAEGRLDMQQEESKRHSVVNIRPKGPRAGRTLNELNARVT